MARSWADVEERFEYVRSSHVLQQPRATTYMNLPLAIMQIEADAQLRILSWTLGKEWSVVKEGLRFYEESDRSG